LKSLNSLTSELKDDRSSASLVALLDFSELAVVVILVGCDMAVVFLRSLLPPSSEKDGDDDDAVGVCQYNQVIRCQKSDEW